jgi:hypothetical protein
MPRHWTREREPLKASAAKRISKPFTARKPAVGYLQTEEEDLCDLTGRDVPVASAVLTAVPKDNKNG